MNITRRQQKIIDYLLSSDSAQTNDILQHINKSTAKKVTRITVIRDIKELVNQKVLLSKGSNRATHYVLSPAYRMLAPINVSKYFANNADERNVQELFNHDVYDYFESELFTTVEKEKLSDLTKQLHQKVDKFSHNPALKRREFERIAIDFSWKSSEIEGNTYSLLETETLINEHQEAQGKTKEEAGMILGHKVAFDLVLENQADFKQLSRAKIEELHKVLVSKLEIKTGYRSLPVGITGTLYRPLNNPHLIKENIDKLAKVVNENSDPLEKALIALAMLSYIQGFEDGNKRTARMVSNALLVSHGLLPISYRSVDTTEYKKAIILFYEQNNISYLKRIFMDQFKFAVKNYF